MITITPEQAYAHGYQDGYHCRPICSHAHHEDTAIAEAYHKGLWDGNDDAVAELIQDMEGWPYD